VEHHYPSFVSLTGTGGVTLNPSDPRSRIVQRERTLESEKHTRAALEGGANGNADAGIRERLNDVGMEPWRLYMYTVGVLIVVLGGTVGMVLGGMWYLDRRNGTPGAGFLAGVL